jgi:hypothetical protein
MSVIITHRKMGYPGRTGNSLKNQGQTGLARNVYVLATGASGRFAARDKPPDTRAKGSKTRRNHKNINGFGFEDL